MAASLPGTAARCLIGSAILVLATGCYTSTHKPVAFKVEADAECPDWAVTVEVDGRYYCVDREAFEEQE